MIQIMAKLVSTCQQLQIWHGQLKQGVEMSNLTDLTNYIILYNWFRRVFELSSKVLHGLANLPGGFHNFQVLFTSFHGVRAFGDLLFQALLLGDPIQPQLGRLCHGMTAERFGPVPGWSNSGCIRMLSLENDHSFFLYHPIPSYTRKNM